MSERPQGEPRERGESGPLGDEETRQVPQESSGDTGRGGGPTRASWLDARRSTEEERRTRLVRPSGQEPAHPGDYFEAAEEREERLRDMYGGVDWLASFLGFVFAAVAGTFLALIGTLVLVSLGFSSGFGGEGLGAAAITSLVVIGALIFLTYFLGGYVAGRLARFDGARNGAMAVVWGIGVSFLCVAIGRFLPGTFPDLIRNFIQGILGPAFSGLQDLGLLGAAIVVAALALMFLGGMGGGRLGSRYHRQIDRTT